MTKRKDPKDLLPVGRPTLYKPEFCQELVKYFDVPHYREITRVNKKTENEYTEIIANSLPSLVGFAAKIGVSRAVLQNWGRVYPEFLYAVTCAKAKAEHMLVTNTLEGRYDSRFAVFVAKNYTDMRDVKDLNIHDDDVKPLTAKEVLANIKHCEEQIEILEAQL